MQESIMYEVILTVCCCFCAGCYKITTVFSHAQTVVLCVGCSTVLCQPTGGKARLTEGTVNPHKSTFAIATLH